MRSVSRYLSWLLLFPFLQRLQLLIKPDIAAVAAFRDLSVLYRLQNGAAFFLYMLAAHETAAVQIWRKLRKCLRQVLLSSHSSDWASKEEKPGVSIT